MRKAQAALVEAEKVMQNVLAVISAAKESKVVLQEAVRAGEAAKAAPAPVKGRARTKSAKARAEDEVNDEEHGQGASSEAAAASQRPKRDRGKRVKEAEEAEEAEVPPILKRANRSTRVSPVVDDDKNNNDVDDDEEDDDLVASVSTRKRENAQVAAVPPVKKPKLKTGGVTRGPNGELVFYVAQKGTGAVECPVYGKPQEEPFERRALIPCEFDALNEEEQKWACLQLCQVYVDHIKRATRGVGAAGPLGTFAEAHAALHQRDGDNAGQLLFVNEHASQKGANPKLLSLVRNAQQLFVNAGVCKESIYYMMAAKLHEELSGIVQERNLTKQFRERLAEMCSMYEIELKPTSLERYLPAGRMMLKCQALAFVNVTLLIDQQKATLKLLERDELRLELAGVAGVARAERASPRLLDIGDGVTVAGDVAALLRVVCTAAPDDLKATRVTANVSALDFAKVLRMNFGNSGAAANSVNVGAVEPYIIWEYANVVNAKLKATGVKGWCVAENFRPELVPEVDWVAVAHGEVGAGLLLNRHDKKVIVHNYEHCDVDALNAVVKTVAEKLNFPKRYMCEFHTVDGYEDVGLLHWLSRVVWGKRHDVVCSVELLRLQVAHEFLKGDLVPQGRSFLDLIRESQPPPPLAQFRLKVEMS